MTISTTLTHYRDIVDAQYTNAYLIDWLILCLIHIKEKSTNDSPTLDQIINDANTLVPLAF